MVVAMVTPTAPVDRFRPTRCGIINLWDYRDEEFVFADGRMVLRGPNGSGKTKALEVLFPFIFDGRIEPRRLNPFAGEERTMKSNLLYRGQESAYAYVWMEFACADEVVTVGVGLRAQRQSDRPTRWYFVTDGRVGRDFSLLGPDDRPLTKRQLADEIGVDAITDRPADHRLATDARLFGLGAGRFEQLLTLILTLRRPQLAKNLDPKGLSQALSDGLRPLDDDLIAEAAHSFGDMESVQRTLTGLIQADAAAAAFLSGYTTYIRTHARAASDALAVRLDQVEAARSGLAKALAERASSASDRDSARNRQHLADSERTGLLARLDSLKESTAYQGRAQLIRLAELTAELQQGARRDREAADRASAELDRRQQALVRAADAHDDALSAVSRAAGEVIQTAQDGGIDWRPVDSADDGGLPRRATARSAARAEDVAAIRTLLATLAEAKRHRDRAQQSLDRAEDRLTVAQSELSRSQQALEAARQQVRESLQDWLIRYSPVLPDDTSDKLTTAVEQLGPADATSLSAVFDDHLGPTLQERRDELARQRELLARNDTEAEGLHAEYSSIAAEQDEAPPPFAARTASRAGRIGVPLWAAVDFAPGVTEDQAAAIESALHAANLLDAWISGRPDGQTDTSETELVALPAKLRPTGATLADVLVPEPDIGVPGKTVSAILASVALLDEAPAAAAAAPSISKSGRFRQGIALGAHHKLQAEYIGATARAIRRTARLAALATRLESTAAARVEIDAGITALQNLIAAVVAARADLPVTKSVNEASRLIDRNAGALRSATDALDAARSDYDRALAEVGGQERALTAAGSRRTMPVMADAVELIADSIARFSRAAADLVTQRQIAATRFEQLTVADGEVGQAQTGAEAAAEQAEVSESGHLARAEELATLRRAVGAEAAQVEREVGETQQAIGLADKVFREAQRKLEAAIELAGRREGQVTGASTALSAAIEEAQHDSRRLAEYSRPDLQDLLRLPNAVPAWPTADEQWPDPPSVAARATDELSADPDAAVPAIPAQVTALHTGILAATLDLRPTESSLKSSRTRVSSSLAELQSQLSAAGHDYRPEWESVDEVIVVRVADEQGFTSIGDFARRIAGARKDQELLLTESERRILEDALLGRLAQQIHDRTTDARDLIAAMNREMRSRRMSSGATIGIGWELADSVDAEQRTVSRLLDRDAVRLSTDDLAQMRAHFAVQIKNARAGRPDRPYSEILSEALDYRRWRTFTLILVAPNGQEDRLTTARHSTLSGGEQSVSLHLPLFAAAHVMLSSADPRCPRLLALDEAFAGIDDPGRSELLGLTAQFDLDLFMTGYDLWATYATVPACAHYDLSHSALEHTVSSLLLVWDGSKILTDAVVIGGHGDLAMALGSPGTRRVGRTDEGELPELG